MQGEGREGVGMRLAEKGGRHARRRRKIEIWVADI